MRAKILSPLELGLKSRFCWAYRCISCRYKQYVDINLAKTNCQEKNSTLSRALLKCERSGNDRPVSHLRILGIRCSSEQMFCFFYGCRDSIELKPCSNES